MEGEGMVAVVRGLRDAGLAVTLLDGNRQYTLLPNSLTQPAQRAPVTNANASTQQCPPKYTADSSTESSALQCDRDAQAIDGRYASMYKTVHCNLRPTSPPVQLTEFPPQRPDPYPGHGNFQVGGAGSGATYSQIRSSSPVTSFRGAMSWPDRGSVCSPRASHEVDAFANSLRKYPCLSPDRSSEVMERLINYTQAKGLSKTFTRNSSSPTRIPEPSSYHTLEPKSTYTRTPRSYEPEVSVRSKKLEDPPTRDRKKDDHHETRPLRSFDVRCIRDMSKRMRESVRAYSSYPYNHPVCPTIKENHDYQPFSYEYQNSSNSVNMEIQAAVKMISKEVATVQREHLTRKTVAVPESPTSSAGEDNVEGECYFVPNLDINTSFKSIQTNFCPSDITLKPRKSAQTVCSSIDLHSKRNRAIVGRKTKSQEIIKVTKDDLKRSLLELIEEVSNTTKSKKVIRDELIKKLFETDRSVREDNKGDRGNSKHEKCHKYVSTFCPTVCDYVGDFQELVGKLRHCYGDTKHVLRSEIKPFRISEYRQLDFVLKDWINNLNLKTKDIGRYMDRGEVLSSVEDRIKELFKNRTKQDFDLKSGIVKIIEEIPIEVNKSYNRNSYLHKLVDVLLKRMRNVIVSHQSGRIRRRPNANRSRKILTEDDIRDFVRAHLLDFFNELNLGICDETLDDLENEFIDVMIDSIDCIRCGHIDDAMDEMNLILQDLGQVTNKQANYITNIILQDFQEMLNNCNFNQTYMILNVNNHSGQLTNKSNNTDVSIGAITEEDLRANLDHYTNQLCQHINNWLDTLNIPQIQDRGFREVVVNDLAGDIVDRHKYIELNHTSKGNEEDELEALKYQIFKWINKLVGDDNQETIGHAKSLLNKINSVPVPMLTNPKHRKMNNTGSGGTSYDPMRPCLGETGPNTCNEDNLKLTAKTTCCLKDSKVLDCLSSGPCCEKDICPNMSKNSQGIQGQQTEPSCEKDTYATVSKTAQGTSSSRTPSQIAPGIQGQSGSLPHTSVSGQGSYGHGPQSFANAHRTSLGSGSPVSRFSNAAQNNYVPPGSYRQSFQNAQGSPTTYNQGQGFGPAQSPYGQVMQVGPGGSTFVPAGQQYGPNAFSEGFGPGNLTQTPYGNGNARPSSDRIGPPGGMFGPTNFNQQSMYDPNLQSMYGAVPGGMIGGPQGVHIPRFTGPGHMGGNFNSSGTRAGPSFSASTTPGSSAPVAASVRNINEDYDDYVKQWVQQIPIAANTPAEQQAADKARLGLYNDIWKSVTKLKLEPNTFTNLYYYQDVFDEEMEGLLKGVPKSQELEAVKPMLKAQLLQKTLAMNEQIKSTNAPASFKQQLTENIENNLPKGTHTGNEEEQQNEELDKQNLADYYILHKRYKDEDTVKSNVHKKNFLKKLDEFLDKIKKRHGIVDMDTNAYANEIINSLDKVPTPNDPAIRDEADDILLGMEVENWIADLPQDPDTAGPLEKRRIRDTIVKKIQELGTNVNYSDSSFATPLKAELPKHLEKIPIKEGTNVDYMVDELANRVKKLSKFIRPKSVSFQDPRNYEEFSRNMPAASSFAEPSQQDGSYFVVGGNVERDVGPKSWGSENASLPQEEQWHSMQMTQAPSGLRNWSDGRQSMQLQPYGQNISGQMPAPGSYSSGGYGLQRQFFPNGQGPFPPNGQGQFSPHVQGGPVPDGHVCTGAPCCPNLACTNRIQGLGPFSQPAALDQVPKGPYGQGFPNAQSTPIPYSQDLSYGHSYGQGIPGGKFPNAVNTSQLPHGQGRQDPYNQNFGSASTPFGRVSQNIQDRSVPESQIHSQGPYAGHTGQVPHGQGFPNVQDSSGPSSQMHPQGQRGSHPGRTSLGPYGQGFPNVQDGSGPRSQMHTQGPHAGHPGQAPQGPYGQRFPNVQDGSGPGSQMHHQGPQAGHPGRTSLGPYGQRFPSVQDGSGQGSQMHPQGLQAGHPGRASLGPYGQGFTNVQDGSGPGNQMHPQGPQAGHLGRASLGPYGQGFPNVQDGSGPHARHPSQDPQGPYGQRFPSSQGGPDSSNQGPGFGPGAPYSTIAPGSSSYDNGQSYGPQVPYGEVSTNGPAGQMPYQGPNTQMGQVYQGPYGQAPYGPVDFNGQGYSDDHPNASAEVQSSMHSPRVNQTAQSSGPISAASQVPDPNRASQPQVPYLQEMAGGGVGVLGISQEAGPSTHTASPQVDQSTNPYQHSGAQRPSGAHHPSATATDASHPPFYKSTDSRGIKHTIDHNKSQRQSSAEQGPQTVCVPVPLGCSTPHQQMNRGVPHRPTKKSRDQRYSTDGDPSARRRLDMDDTDTSTEKEKDRCRCVRRGRRCRVRKQTDDCQVEYRPCIPVMRYPCYY